MDNEVKDYLEYVADKDGIFEIHLGLDGIRCIQCIVSIENFLKKQKGVVEARGNIGAKTLFLSWRGDISEINFFVKEVKKLGYTIFPLDDASAKSFSAEEHALLKKVIVAGAAAVQIMMISMGVWAGALDGTITHYTQFLIQILATIIALPAIMYCGLPFFRNAYTALKNKKTNMDVPISIAIITSSIISVQETIKNTSYTYYDAAISLIFALLIGRYLDLKTSQSR